MTRDDEDVLRERELRIVLALPLHNRREFLAEVEKCRGKPAVEELKVEIVKWYAARARG